MNKQTHALDYERLFADAQRLRQEFDQAQPFSHLVLDNFLSPELTAQLNQQFPSFEAKTQANRQYKPVLLDDGSEAQLGKQWLSREQLVPLIYRRLYWELNSYPFVNWLEQVTAIDGLLGDPHLAGGGVHQTQSGGYLKVHADFNKHPNYNLDRRLNLLIYLNQDWPAEYGGDLELWSTDMNRCEKTVAPIAGRCVIFRTTSASFHGHPRPLTCPQERARRSIALYYYSNGRPDEEHADEHGTLWQQTPS